MDDPLASPANSVELDYAFLADYATVQQGKLTAVGASYTVIEVARELPVPHNTAIAMRVRAPEDCEAVEIGVSVKAPRNGYEASYTHRVQPGPEVLRYNGKMGILVAASMTIPIVDHGLYTVTISLDGQLARTLKFDAVPVGSPTD